MEPLPNKTLGQLLREKRQNADLSLRDLGEKLKDPVTNTPVSAAFLSDIENGRRFPSDDMIEKLAEVLDADAGELRRCDPRGPAKEMQDLATMNAKYAFAFRRAVDFVQDQALSPDEFVRRVENDRAAELVRRFETIFGRPLFESEWETVLKIAQSQNALAAELPAASTISEVPPPSPSPPSQTSHEPET
jgi:transcriptional regulator with XRE-family HTH domain